MMKTVGVFLSQRRKTSKLNILVNVMLVCLISFCLAEFAFGLRYTSIWVDGRSMLPTIIGEDEANGLKGEYVFADKMLKPDYGDIVVVRRTAKINGRTETSYIIKRVVAFGGDTVKMERGVLYIKYSGSDEFTRVEEDYVSDLYNDKDLPKNTVPEYSVDEGTVYLLGDNRNESNDSRANGEFPERAIVGVVPQWAMDNKSAITSIFNFLDTVFKN